MKRRLSANALPTRLVLGALIGSTSLLCGSLLCGVASADYINPPDWSGSSAFTHQSWSFAEPGNPVLADPGYVNPGGEPWAQRSHGQWRDDLGSQFDLDGNFVQQRQGGWYFEGPLLDYISTIDIPAADENLPPELWRSELWLQATLKTNSSSPQILLQAFDEFGEEFDLISGDVEFIGEDPLDGGTWAVATFAYSISGRPETATVRLAASLLGEDPSQSAPAEFFVIDQIDVDTRVIPESSVLVMLSGIVMLSLVVFFWRRQTA